MGAKFLTWAEQVPLDAERRAPVAVQRLVLLLLASHADGRGVAWPSVLRMAETAGVSRSTVKAALSVLVKRGYIEPDGERSIGGPGNTTRWRLVGTAVVQRPALRAIPGAKG